MNSQNVTAGDAASGPRIRVGLVDDQQLVRSGFKMLLSSQPDLEVVFEAADGAEALSAVKSVAVDVVLMDIRMPEMNGIEATRFITEGGGAQPRVIVLTTFNLDEYVIEALSAGASGFLLKDAEPEELLRAIRVVHAGDAVISPEMTRKLLTSVKPLLQNSGTEKTVSQENAVAASLTERELEVLKLIAEGLSNSEIASHLTLSEATVKTHVAHILRKTSSRDRVQAVIFAFETGIV